MDAKQEAVERLKILKPKFLHLSIFFDEFDTIFIQDITENISEKQRLREATALETNILNNAKKLTSNLPYFAIRQVDGAKVLYYIFYVGNNEDEWEEERGRITQNEDGIINPLVFESEINIKIDNDGNQDNTIHNKYKELLIDLNQ